jgi:hypothetical protein
MALTRTKTSKSLCILSAPVLPCFDDGSVVRYATFEEMKENRNREHPNRVDTFTMYYGEHKGRPTQLTKNALPN